MNVRLRIPGMPKSIKNNLVSIDILRGFAASSVFLFHYGFAFMIFKIFGTHSTDFIAVIGAKYGVPLFFLISGFCIHLSQLKQNQHLASDRFHFSKYLIRRFWRIYPAYVIILFFSCSVSAIAWRKK